MIYRIDFQLNKYSAAGFEGDLQQRTALDYPLGSSDPLLAGWPSVQLSQVDIKLPKSDFFSVFKPGILGVMPAVLNHSELKEHFSEEGELLPVTFGGEDAYLFHPLRKLDAIDKKRSRRMEVSSGNFICNHPVFPTSFRSPYWLFRILESTSCYTTPEFVAYYQEHNLSGLEFHPQRMSEA